MKDSDNTRPRAETPVADTGGTGAPLPEQVWGSDIIAATLRQLDVPFLALNPGASYRGLHDSLVNYNGNQQPQMLLCLHEEAAVAIAHGYAKASDKMMGAVLHSNVGLMHASMAIFDAWCDRMPMLLLGATGPVDAAKRRPWIDWIHTSRDQGALIRDYIKWDDQPASVPATQEALLRAVQIAQTAPRGPAYVNIDAWVQESPIAASTPIPDASRYAPPPAVHAAPATVRAAAALLSRAQRPVILAGRVNRSQAGWDDRVALAEKLGAQVITDLKTAAAFPTDHALHVGAPGFFVAPAALAALKAADVVLSLDWIDLAGTLKQAFGAEPIAPRVIQVSLDQHNHRGWSMDHFGLAPIDCYLLCEPEVAVADLLPCVEARGGSAPRATGTRDNGTRDNDRAVEPGPIGVRALAQALNAATHAQNVCLTRLPLGWAGQYRHFRGPLDYLGYDGGAGIGSGPGNAVGAALALKGSGRVPIAVLGDGDFLMGVTAVWTAAHFEIPLLIVVANNRSYFNDELHQERVAVARARPVANKWIGQAISDPDIDIAAMGAAQGARGIGPVHDAAELAAAITQGIAMVRTGQVCVIDARVLPGYDSDMSGSQSAHKR